MSRDFNFPFNMGAILGRQFHGNFYDYRRLEYNIKYLKNYFKGKSFAFLLKAERELHDGIALCVLREVMNSKITEASNYLNKLTREEIAALLRKLDGGSSDEEPSDEEPSDEEPSDEEPSDEEPSDEEPSDEGNIVLSGEEGRDPNGCSA